MLCKLFVIFTLLSKVANAGYARGAIQLDISTFEKIIPHFAVSIVKVDKAYPHGKNQTYFEKMVSFLTDDRKTIVAEIGVQEFGEKENVELAMRLGVAEKKHWPTLFIFKRDSRRWTAKYDGIFSLNRLRHFIDDHAEVEWSCPPCIFQLDQLVKRCLFDGTMSSEELLAGANQFVAALSVNSVRRTTADYYVKLIERIKQIGQPAVTIESERLLRLLSGKNSVAKQRLLKDRIDIIYYSFNGNLWKFQDEQIDEDETPKDEL